MSTIYPQKSQGKKIMSFAWSLTVCLRLFQSRCFFLMFGDLLISMDIIPQHPYAILIQSLPTIFLSDIFYLFSFILTFWEPLRWTPWYEVSIFRDKVTWGNLDKLGVRCRWQRIKRKSKELDTLLYLKGITNKDLL